MGGDYRILSSAIKAKQAETPSVNIEEITLSDDETKPT
jgi:hypothetical protein